MANKPSVRYPANSNPPTASYPDGSAKNSATPTSKDGYPWDKDQINDWIAFFSGIADRANINLSGITDTILVSDYLDGLDKTVGRIFNKKSDITTKTFKAGNRISTLGFTTTADGGGLDYIIRTAAEIGAEPIDGLRNVATANTNVAQSDKPFYTVRNGGGGFAPNEMKYLFMNPQEYSAGNSGADPIVEGNQFHFYAEGSDIRVEFEAATGDMQFYIESGLGQSAWYGWQNGPNHLYSFGTDPTSNFDLKLCEGFGVEGIFAHFLIRGAASTTPGQVQIKQDDTGAGLGIAPLAVRATAITGAAGLLVEVGLTDALYLASYRLFDGTEKTRIDGLGKIKTQLGTEALPVFSFLSDPDTGMFGIASDNLGFSTGGNEQLRITSAGRLRAGQLGDASAPVYSWISDTDTGIFNPGSNALSFATAGVERARINSLGNFLLNATASGDGEGVLEIGNASVVPTVNGVAGAIYVEAGALKYRGTGGTITVLAAA